MSCSERCHFEQIMLGHLRSPPHGLPEKYIKGGCSGERFTVYTWHLIKARAFASPNTSERHRYRCSPTSDSRGLPWKPSGETIRQFSPRTGSKMHFLESSHGFLHRIQRVSVKPLCSRSPGRPCQAGSVGADRWRGGSGPPSTHAFTESTEPQNLPATSPPLTLQEMRNAWNIRIFETKDSKREELIQLHLPDVEVIPWRLFWLLVYLGAGSPGLWDSDTWKVPILWLY